MLAQLRLFACKIILCLNSSMKGLNHPKKTQVAYFVFCILYFELSKKLTSGGVFCILYFVFWIIQKNLCQVAYRLHQNQGLLRKEGGRTGLKYLSIVSISHTNTNKYKHTQIQIQIHTNTNRNTHKYKYHHRLCHFKLPGSSSFQQHTNTNTHKYKYKY